MNTKSKLRTLSVVAFVLLTTPAFAQVGNDNVTGTSGPFTGEVTSGCAYNAYTGSAHRSVTDISVAGGAGYPLAFTRMSTSRYTAGFTNEMGKAGNWLHSYSWSIDTYNGSDSGWPKKFIVNYPDGRRVTFTSYGGGAYIMASVGVSGLIDFAYDDYPVTRGHCYVNLPDGGQVRFNVAISNGQKHFVYTLSQIVDPYGQLTTVNKSGNLMTVTEPAGRMLKIFYGTGPASDSVITRVEEWMTATQKGRTVSYNYSLYTGGNTKYSTLTSVVYLDATGSTYATATYTYRNDNLSASGRPLLSTADDPMYAGPMRKISYAYAPSGTNADGSKVVSGQIQSEKSGTPGQAVSTLNVNTGGRSETTGDGRTRTFTFRGGGLIGTYTDFLGKESTVDYDGTWFPAYFRDRNHNVTLYDNNPYSRLRYKVRFPSTPNDTPSGTQQTSVSTDIGDLNCVDTNNRDWYRAYWPCKQTDEAGNITRFFRYGTDSPDGPPKAIQRVEYPDTGVETFKYNSFGQVTEHRLRTGGLETFTYNSRGLLTEYRDAYHLGTGDLPNLRYTYDSLDRIASVTDALGTSTTDWNHTTSFAYNWRGQVTTTTLPIDPVDSQRHTIVNAYNNSTGTLTSVTDQLSHVTSYTYDDYRRVRSVTTPGHNTPLTSQLFYDANGTGDDYTHTDANVTYAKSPSGKKIVTQYNPNKQKSSVTASGPNGEDSATTSFGYDDNGNLTSVKSPKEQTGQPFAGQSTVSTYDERNRPMSVTDALANPTTFWYDAGGRKWKIIRANGQVTSFDSYDAMNRLLQQTVQQAPDPDAVTKWTYYTSGLLATMKDPHLVETSSSEAYTYGYDLMGRKTQLQYPLDSNNARRTENWRYDTKGRVDQFTNRATNHQTLSYDNLDRLTDTSWDDGTTPSVHNSYDVAFRLTGVTNANATISRVLFRDGLLNTDTTTYADNVPRTVTYTYDSDGNRSSIQWPNNAYSFTYNYTGRHQLWKLINSGDAVATFSYDSDGNLTSRALDNSTNSTFIPDALDRITHITHALDGTTRTFDYAYDSVGNRKWTKRDGENGDVFGYDLNDQSTSVLLDVPDPDTAEPGGQTVTYDANGNRTTFSPYGPVDVYTTNYLNQYAVRNSSAASYDNNGNLTTGLDASIYTYDAQNRLLTANKGGTTEQFCYDGLNRQLKRVAGSVILPTSAASRMTHGAVGTFDTNLPITGMAGIECRGGGVSNAYQMVLNFPHAVSFSSAAVTSGTGTISGTSISNDGTQVTINLAGVNNQQTIVVTLSGVTDGTVTNNVFVGMAVLIGDTNADGFVDSADISQVQSQSGAPVTASNFREDLNMDGFIDSADVAFVSSKSGTTLPNSPPLGQVAATSYLIYDGWNLIAEYASGSTTPSVAYLSGANGLVKNLTTNRYYYQDASGSTSHLASDSGNLLEWYRYDLQGTPIFYNASDTQIPNAQYGIRHLFTGQQWYSEVGLYDLRNRFYSPDIGRFLQADPIGFAGDPANVYRYCRNNPLKGFDPLGLQLQDDPNNDKKPEQGSDGGGFFNGTTLAPVPLYGSESDPGSIWASPNVSASDRAVVGAAPTASEQAPGVNWTGGLPGGLVSVTPGGIVGGDGGAPSGGAGGRSASGPITGSSGPSGAPPGSSTSGNGLAGLRVGDIYNLQRGGDLDQQYTAYVLAHRAELESEYRFVNAIYLGAGYYSGVWLVGAGAIEAGFVPASLAEAKELGVAAAYATIVRASFVTTGTYGFVAGVQSGGAANPAIREAVHEIIEFQVGHPGRGIPGLWP